MKKKTKIIILILFLLVFVFLLKIKFSFKKVQPKELVFMEPKFLFQEENFFYEEFPFQSSYSLPLKELPLNYLTDIEKKLQKGINSKEKESFLSEGSLVVEGDGFEKFDDAYQYLFKNEIPIYITSDYILYLLNIQLSEIKNNIEIEKITPALQKLLEGLIKETERQYSVVFQKRGKNADLAKQNLAYLSAALKLLNPSFSVSDLVSKQVNSEISKINNASGVYLSDIFSENCPTICRNIITQKEDVCIFPKADNFVEIGGKNFKIVDVYKQYCLGKCYCEDYSFYQIPQLYSTNDNLKNYWLSTTYLKRMVFSLNDEDSIKRSVLLTLALEHASIFFEGKEIPAKDLWRRIYAVISFFDGFSKNFNFYDWAQVINQIMKEKNIPFADQINLSEIKKNEFKRILGAIKGEEKLLQFENNLIDLFGNIEEQKIGLSMLPSSFGLGDYIFQNLLFDRVGPNPQSKSFREVRGYMKFWEKFDCSDMEKDKFQKGWQKEEYWRQICKAGLEVYKVRPQEFYSVCKMIPTNMELMAVLGSQKAQEIIKNFYGFESFCDYSLQKEEIKKEISSFFPEKWQESLDNFYFWLSQSIIKDNQKENFPSWLKSQNYQVKNLITAHSFLATEQAFPFFKESGYYYGQQPSSQRFLGYLEPNPLLYAKIIFLLKILVKGLQDQEFMSGNVFLALDRTQQIFNGLKEISQKELRNEPLLKEDEIFIKDLFSNFKEIIGDLAVIYFSQKMSLDEVEKNLYVYSLKNFYREDYTQKILLAATGKLDWLIVANKTNQGIFAFVGPIFSYYEFLFPSFEKISAQDWMRGSFLKKVWRPLFYSLLNFPSFDSPYYIVK